MPCNCDVDFLKNSGEYGNCVEIFRSNKNVEGNRIKRNIIYKYLFYLLTNSFMHSLFQHAVNY